MKPFGRNIHGPNIDEGLCPLFGEGRLGPHLTQSRRAEAYVHVKCHLDPSSRLATISMGRKFGGLRPLFLGGGAGSPSNNKSSGPKPTSKPTGILIHAPIWPQQIWVKNWPRWGRGADSPSNTVSGAEIYLHAKFHLDPSNHLATVHKRHRQDRTTVW